MLLEPAWKDGLPVCVKETFTISIENRALKASGDPIFNSCEKKSPVKKFKNRVGTPDPNYIVFGVVEYAGIFDNTKRKKGSSGVSLKTIFFKI